MYNLFKVFAAKSFRSNPLVEKLRNSVEKRLRQDFSASFNTIERYVDLIEEDMRQKRVTQLLYPYIKWMLIKYGQGKLGTAEDVGVNIDALTIYHKLKVKKKLQLQHRDINKIASRSSLFNLLSEYRQEQKGLLGEGDKREEQAFYKSKQATLIHNDSKIKIVSPHTHTASCFFGRHTRWCTASRNNNIMFQDYTKKGDLYIILIKKQNKRYQFWWPLKHGTKSTILESWKALIEAFRTGQPSEVWKALWNEAYHKRNLFPGADSIKFEDKRELLEHLNDAYTEIEFVAENINSSQHMDELDRPISKEQMNKLFTYPEVKRLYREKAHQYVRMLEIRKNTDPFAVFKSLGSAQKAKYEGNLKLYDSLIKREPLIAYAFLPDNYAIAKLQALGKPVMREFLLGVY